MYDHLTADLRRDERLGWGNYANDHEDGNGQFEQNFEYADALTTADRVVTLRYLLSVMAAERGMVATFMPKPFADKTGSGLHLHMSLTSGGTPVFPADDDARTRGLGLSPTAYSFIAGILEHACALQAVIAPTVNSYKRTGATTTASGASWAPRTPTYGGNDRTHYIRVPDDQRVELRGGDGLGQPVPGHRRGTGRWSRRHQAQPRPRRDRQPGRGRPLPPTLLHAVDDLEADAVVTGCSTPPDRGVRVRYFAELKREEFFGLPRSAAWEIDRYLTAF